jgi:hypothetical protein
MVSSSCAFFSITLEEPTGTAIAKQGIATPQNRTKDISVDIAFIFFSEIMQSSGYDTTTFESGRGLDIRETGLPDFPIVLISP